MRVRSAAALMLALLVIVPSLWAQAPGINFFNTVAIGDSLAAGFISGGFSASGQQNSFMAQLMRHLRSFMFLPLIAEPGLPAELQLIRPGFPPEVAPKPGISSGRVGALVVPTNLAVPGATLSDAIRQRPDLPIDSTTDLVLGLPSLIVPGSAPIASQLEMAEFLRPSVAVVWIGNNDVLGAALAGSPTRLTSVDSFRGDYNMLLGRLRAVGANLIVLNLPDVTSIPAVIPLRTAAELVGLPPGLVALGLGVSQEDFLLLSQLPAYQAILNGQARPPLRDDQVLTAAEARTIRERVNAFNEIIGAAASANGAVLVDTNQTLTDVAARGVEAGGRRLTAQLLGGLFSLDGVHPTYTGHAVIANELVTTLNRRLGLSLPPINIAAVMAADPLVLNAPRLEVEP